jgi:two-component system chemotaxis response regulator CheB
MALISKAPAADARPPTPCVRNECATPLYLSPGAIIHESLRHCRDWRLGGRPPVHRDTPGRTAGLPACLDAAVFVVLHIPADAHSELAAVLQRRTRLTVTAAVDGEAIVAGRVYVGVPDRHLLIDQDRVRLTRGPKEARPRPSVDALFRSAAVSGGPNVVGVVLSGALDDGAAGLWAIKDRGGVTLVQDPATAEYASMPKSAARYTVIDASLPADGLAKEVVRQVATMPRPDPQTDAAGLSTEVTITLEGDGLRAGVMTLGHVSGTDSHSSDIGINYGNRSFEF